MKNKSESISFFKPIAFKLLIKIVDTCWALPTFYYIGLLI